MKKYIIVAIVIIFAFIGCKKINEAQKTAKELQKLARDAAKTAEKTRDTTEKKTVEQKEEKIEIELSEKVLTDYYTLIKKLTEKHGDYNFESGFTAAIKLGQEGKDFGKIVNSENIISYEEYGDIQKQLMKNAMGMQGIRTSNEILDQLRSSVKRHEDEDLSNKTEEEKRKILDYIENTGKKIVDIEEKQQSEENKKIIEISELNKKIREEILK